MLHSGCTADHCIALNQAHAHEAHARARPQRLRSAGTRVTFEAAGTERRGKTPFEPHCGDRWRTRSSCRSAALGKVAAGLKISGFVLSRRFLLQRISGAGERPAALAEVGRNAIPDAEVQCLLGKFIAPVACLLEAAIVLQLILGNIEPQQEPDGQASM
jgi:hypothetical protein